jgi:hypothetical protein
MVRHFCITHDRQRTYHLTLRRARETMVATKKMRVLHICARVRACVRVWVGDQERAHVALLIQHRTHMWHTVLSLWTPWLQHYLIHGKVFGKTLLNPKCIFWSLQLSSETFLILWRIQQDAVINAKTSSCKEPLIQVGF